MHRGDVVVTKIASVDNLEDPFTKSLLARLLIVINREWDLDALQHGFESKWEIVRDLY